MSTMDIDVATTGDFAQIFVNGGMVGSESSIGGTISFTSVDLGPSGLVTITAHCFNSGSGNGDTVTDTYYVD